MNLKTSQTDPIETSLELLEAENQKFRNHWLWRKLGCCPEEFFCAFEKHLNKLQVPQEQWEAAKQRLRESNRVRAKENSTTFNPKHLEFMQGISV